MELIHDYISFRLIVIRIMTLFVCKSSDKMSKKRQAESKASSLTVEGSKKPIKLKDLSFDEIAAIINSGDSEKLKKIIVGGSVSNIDMRSTGLLGSSLLMTACKSGFVECARVLLDHNADINYRIYSRSTLSSACLSGHCDMLRFIIERRDRIVDFDLTYLFECSEIILNTEIATVLVGYIQGVNWGETHSSFLLNVCKAGNATIARMLLERGASYSHRYHNPLVAASCKGHLEVVQLLLDWRANEMLISMETIRSAFRSACNCGHLVVARCLLERGTYVDDATLMLALCESVVEERNMEVVEFLLDKCADFNVVVPGYGSSAWTGAIEFGHPAIVRRFLDRGADPNAVDDKGDSPLKIALWRPGIFPILLERGADPNKPFADGSTALLRLMRYTDEAYTQALSNLLAMGADPNLAHATTGQTALMKAASDLNIGLVKLLLEYGADVTQVNREGENVLDMLGRTRKYGEMMELCTQYIDSNKPGAKQLLK